MLLLLMLQLWHKLWQPHMLRKPLCQGPVELGLGVLAGLPMVAQLLLFQSSNQVIGDSAGGMRGRRGPGTG